VRARRLDHVVLTVRDLDRAVSWYVAVLGARPVVSDGRRRAVLVGEQRLNLHLLGREIEPHAAAPTAGSADLCVIVDGPVDAVRRELDALGVVVEVGPVPRKGAVGPMTSLYVRDPDENLVELGVPDG
jgi:catechol 2,3-dioxygenase-like lactoylglutathione lyase family enzyme